MGGDTQTNAEDGRLHIAMLPFLAFGHIVPFVEVSKKLAAYGARVSFLSVPGNIPRISSLLSPLASVDVVELELPAVEGLPPEVQSTAEGTPAMAELLKKALDLTKPQVRSFLAKLRPHVIFHDFALEWLPSVAHPLGVKAAGISYIFKSFDGMPCAFDRFVSCTSASWAIAIKTCREMEAPYLDYMEAQYGKPVLLAGPVVPEPPTGQLEARWACWLDSYPAGSVVYCSFGSETFLTDEGIHELALGLELTGLPFFLVLNFPKGGGGGEDGVATLKKKLPEGFEERVRGNGVVHSGWVHQQHILAHPSVGCFLCHAGLSSVVEGLINGCQLVALPQKVDQFLNARLFTGDLRAGVEVRRREEDGGFTREGVREAVSLVMSEEEAGGTVRENNRRWRQFLLDPEVDRGFTAEFVGKLKELAGCTS